MFMVKLIMIIRINRKRTKNTMSLLVPLAFFDDTGPGDGKLELTVGRQN